MELRCGFPGDNDGYEADFRKAATSLLLIVLVAVGARLAFAWNQSRQIPAEVLRTVPFQTETGHIAYSWRPEKDTLRRLSGIPDPRPGWPRFIHC